jgi:hypothetical protein
VTVTPSCILLVSRARRNVQCNWNGLNSIMIGQSERLKITVVWDVLSRSLICRYPRFEGTWYLRLQSSEYVGSTFARNTSKNYQTTRRHIPEDSNIHSHHHENLKPQIFLAGNLNVVLPRRLGQCSLRSILVRTPAAAVPFHGFRRLLR